MHQKMSGSEVRENLGKAMFAARWLLYPVNAGLVMALVIYVAQFLHDDFRFVGQVVGGWLRGEEGPDLEALMVFLLGFVDASMVANLIIMIVQSGHEIFILRFDEDPRHMPQYLAHMDTGIMKVKVALSISSITLVQILKDFVNLEHIDWPLAEHRMVIHMAVLVSALTVAIIWRVTHPGPNAVRHNEPHGEKT